MTISLLRFSDLRAGGIVSNWPQLRHLQEDHGFPPGRLLSPRIRAWTPSEVEDWIAKRPVESTRPLQGAAKARRERRRKAEQSRVEGQAMRKNGKRPGQKAATPVGESSATEATANGPIATKNPADTEREPD